MTEPADLSPESKSAFFLFCGMVSKISRETKGKEVTFWCFNGKEKHLYTVHVSNCLGQWKLTGGAGGMRVAWISP